MPSAPIILVPGYRATSVGSPRAGVGLVWGLGSQRKARHGVRGERSVFAAIRSLGSGRRLRVPPRTVEARPLARLPRRLRLPNGIAAFAPKTGRAVGSGPPPSAGLGRRIPLESTAVGRRRVALPGERGWIKVKTPNYRRRDSEIEAMERARRRAVGDRPASASAS
jgi:hypothetical protein